MDSSAGFDDLMRRLTEGDEQAAAELFDRYARRLMGVARQRLGFVAHKVDPESVVQSVMMSFFQRQREGRVELINWKSLWGLLSTITLRKCGHRVEFFLAARRNVGRENSPTLHSDDSLPTWEAIARDPSVSDAAILNETLEALFNSLDSRDREILQLHLENHDVSEISNRINKSERTVRRCLEQIEQRLEMMCRTDPSTDECV